MVERDDIPQKILLENSEEDRKSTPEGSLVRFESDDIAQQTKQKIGDFFRREIEDANNQSTAVIDDGPELDAFGDDSNSENSFTAKFPEGQASEARTAFENQSRSTTFDRDVLPGKQGSVNTQSEVQASLLLGELRNDPTPIANEVARRIGENASFSPNQKYISDPDNPQDTFVPEDVAGTRRHLIQPRLGAHGPKKLFGTVEVEEGVTPTLTIEQLQNLGCQILLESSGEVFVPSDPTDPGQAAAARASTSAVPGVARLGFRVDANRFSATQVIRNNVDENIRKPEVEIELSSNAKASYGSVNNPYVPFAAVSSGFSSVIVGGLLSLTYAEIFIALSELLSNEFGTNDSLTSAANIFSDDASNQASVILEKRKRLGSYIPKERSGQLSTPGEFGLALVGLNNVDLLIETQFDYKSALQEGVRVFFGIDNTSGVNFALGLASTGLRIAEAPGYYNGILRALTRAVADPLFDIAGNLISLGGGNDRGLQASGPADVNPLIGPPSDPTNLLGIVNVIKESKFLKFMNILAAIGDTSLKAGSNISDIDAINDVISNPFTEDGEPDLTLNLAALHKKNRLSNQVEPQFRGSLAWGANTVRSMFFMNDQIITAESIWANDTEGYQNLAANRNVKLKKGVRRFTQEEVKLMERELDSYYVPFYFHDLRTNEIIAFHAFLESVNDSYDVEYNEADGYGRIGKVYTYKNTNRNIQLSFKVVSTNPGDFSEMWYKINKLTMMLFPQYTAGRAISFDSQKFIQPFSQIPSSSPLIRLRVGDLIKSNYSDFDLARLFGIGTESFQLSEQARQRDAAARQRTLERKAELRRQFENYQFQEGDLFVFQQPVAQVGSTAARTSATQFVQVRETQEELRQRQAATRRAEVDRQRASRRAGRRPGDRPPEIPVGATARVTAAPGNKIYDIVFVPALPGTDGGTTYVIDLSAQSAGLLSVPDYIINERAQAAAPGDTASTDEPITDYNDGTLVRNFFASGDRDAETAEGNPIFKSFDSTRGQGLAGVIKNMAFNWDGALWETEGLNNRAPKWCTIDITFAPVWDLNPGLDANGNMIGAPYNIGQILKQIKLARNRDTESQATYVSKNAQASVDTSDEEESVEDFNPITGLIG